MTTTTLAVLVPLLPFLGAVAGLLLGRRAPGFVRPLAVLPTLAASALAVVVAVDQGGGQADRRGHPAHPDRLRPRSNSPCTSTASRPSSPSWSAWSPTCVQLYSTGYLRDDPRYTSYAALVSLFTSAMLLVVYSGDLMVLLVGWEIMGICSYFLVGHYWETPEARAASLKAFLVTKLGDVPFLIGLFALATDAGTFRITGVLQAASDRRHRPPHPDRPAAARRCGRQVRAVPAAHLAARRDGRPHPVSALIHAATMVAAGIYFVARLLPVFAASGGRDDRARRDGRGHHGRLGARRPRPGRHQARPRLLDHRPARLHVGRPGRRRPRRRRLPPPLARRLQGAPLPRAPA